MENKINLSNEIRYVVDYRSCPSGLGSIFLDEVGGNKQILITDQDTGPKDMSEAKETFNPDSMPDFVDHIPLDSQFWDIINQCLGAILVSHHVKYVIDSELAYDCPDLTDPDGGDNKTIFTIQNWLKARDIKGIL
jgi:hypothetical protein